MTVPLAHRIDGPAAAPPVVFIGSLGSDLTMWEPQYTALCGEFRVITADLRGHGDSPGPSGPYTIADLAGDVLALVDDLTPEQPIHLVGLSLGGAVAQWIAAHEPARLRSLTLLCTSARFGDPEPWRERAAAVRESGTAAIADAVVGRWFTPGFADGKPELTSRCRRMVETTPDEGYAGCCDALAGWDGRADLARIAAPTLVIAGAQDPATGEAHLRAIADGIDSGRAGTDGGDGAGDRPGADTGHAELRVLDPGAHLANVERAARVNTLIREHMRAAERAAEDAPARPSAEGPR